VKDMMDGGQELNEKSKKEIDASIFS